MQLHRISRPESPHCRLSKLRNLCRLQERGLTLTAWLATRREFYGVLAMLTDLATQLASLHGLGHVHRGIKPENMLVMMQTQTWKLIDFGIAAPAGARLISLCSSLHLV